MNCTNQSSFNSKTVHLGDGSVSTGSAAAAEIAHNG